MSPTHGHGLADRDGPAPKHLRGDDRWRGVRGQNEVLHRRAQRTLIRPRDQGGDEADPWSGNVRELENCLTRAVVMMTGSVIRPEHLGLEGSPSGPAHVTSLEQAERAHVAGVLQATGGHKSRAAEILEISRPRLDRLIEKHDLTSLTEKSSPKTDEPKS